MADLNFNVEGNNEDLIKRAEQICISVRAMAIESEKAGRASSGFAKVWKKTFDVIGGTEALKQFVSDVVRVRGEFQQLEFSFATLLQSKEKSDALMSQIIKTAAETPFDVKELAAGTKQLIEYGVASDQINGTLLRLGDIASGVGVPLEQLTSLYGSVMTQGSLYDKDLGQFTASGIPMLQGLADALGVSTEKVNEMVSAGKIGFPEVQKVIENLTNEGGRFYGSMDEQSNTIVGEMNNLRDAWDAMLNKIGQSQEGIISDSIDGVQFLVENYEQIGKIILSLIETYGVYRTACMAHIVLTQSLATTQMMLGATMAKLKQSFLAFTGAMNLNPWVLAATAIIGLGVAMWNLSEHTTAAQKAQKRFNDEQSRFNQQQEDRKQKIDGLINTIQDETETEYAKVGAYEELKKLSPALTEAYKREELANLDLSKSQQVLNQERDGMDYDNVVSNVNKITESLKQLKAENGKVIGASPSGVVTVNNNAEIEQNEEDLKKYRKQLDEYNRLKKIAEEKSMTIESRIEIAVDSLDKIKEEYNKVNTLMLAERAKMDENPLYTIPLKLQLEFNGWDRLLQQAQSKVADLKSQQAKGGTYQQDLASAKSSWETAKREYQTSLKKEGATSAEVKEKKSYLEKKEKAYKDLGGVTDNKPDNSIEKKREQEKRLQEAAEKAAQTRKEAEISLEFERQQELINLMDEGSDKVLAQIQLDYDKRFLEIRKKERELLQVLQDEERANWEKNNPDWEKKGKTFTPKIKALPQKEATEFQTMYSNAYQTAENNRQAYYASEKQAMNEYLKEYGTYMEKRQAIIALGEEKKKGKNEWEQKGVDKNTQEDLSNLEVEALEKTTAISGLFSDMKNRTVKEMHTIADEAQRALDFIKGGKWDAAQGADFGITQESFDALQNATPEIKKIEKHIEDLNEQANASDTALNKMGIGFEHLFAAGSNPENLKKALGEIESSMNEVMQSTKFFADCLSGLGDSFGSETMSGVAEGVNVAMDAAGAAMSGAQAGAMFGPWGAAAGAAIGLVSSLGSSLAKLHDAKNEKNIQNIQKQIEVLEESYSNLGESLDAAFSSDASNLIDQQNTLLEQQKVLIRNQIAEEQSKKKSDSGRIEGWEKQIEDIDKVIAGNKEKKIDVIFGEDLKAAIDNFAQAYADAWSAGDDRAKSSRDLVKNMIKQMISEAVKAASSEPMEKLREKLAGFFTNDKIISDWERQQIEKDAEKIMNDLDRQYGWADEYMKGDEQGSSSQDSTKGGFASMSQETGDELNGRFTALQISNEDIKNSMLLVLGNLSSLCTTTSDSNILLTEMRNLSIMSNGHLEDIAKHTKVLLGFGEKLDNIDYNTKSLTIR